MIRVMRQTYDQQVKVMELAEQIADVKGEVHVADLENCGVPRVFAQRAIDELLNIGALEPLGEEKVR
jgi:hypothetical protein